MPVDEIPGVDSKLETLDCYSGLYKAKKVRVFYPDDPEQIRTIFARARERRLEVTFRSGGHSFDAQSLGRQIVISMRRLDEIDPLPAESRVRVGPGAAWGDILAELQPFGLVPAVTVTGSDATAGGTLSGDCLSRFSPAYGKEGTWIEHFRLITLDGGTLECRPPGPNVPRSQWTDEERAFAGAIGGLGYLGAVVSITYRVLRVAPPETDFRVKTVVRRYETCKDLADHLVPETKRTALEDSDPQDPEKLDAIWSALVPRGRSREPSALFFTSAFVRTDELDPMLLHQPQLNVRVLVEWAMRVRPLWRVIWWWGWHRIYKRTRPYFDEVHGFTFFVDGNARAKKLWPFGTLKTVQQTFVVPSDLRCEGSQDAADRLAGWLEHTRWFFKEKGLEPTLHDILWLPRDVPFMLSATSDTPGFAVSYAFETSRKKTIEKVQQAFTELSDHLWDHYGGRVYLVKNVSARPATLDAMYGDNAREFFTLKRRLDPGGLLRNEFLERTFGWPPAIRLRPMREPPRDR